MQGVITASKANVRVEPCVMCVYGSGPYPVKNSQAACTPQQKVRGARYVCAGFRRITGQEARGKQPARPGAPRGMYNG